MQFKKVEFDYNDYCCQKLLEAIPEFRNNYPKYNKFIEKMYQESFPCASYLAYNVFIPFVMDIIKHGHQNDMDNTIFKRCFQFLEDLVDHKDEMVRHTIETHFIELFLEELDHMSDAGKYLLPKSLEVARHLADVFLHRDPITWESRKKPGDFDYREYCFNELFVKIPEIQSDEAVTEIKEEIKYVIDNELGATILYENVFVPFVLELINKPKPSEEEQKLLTRCYQLIEDLVTHEDFNVRCVGKVACIEALLNQTTSIEDIKRIMKYMLPKSLQIAKAM